jgi:hypothetical protein
MWAGFDIHPIHRERDREIESKNTEEATTQKDAGSQCVHRETKDLRERTYYTHKGAGLRVRTSYCIERNRDRLRIHNHFCRNVGDSLRYNKFRRRAWEEYTSNSLIGTQGSQRHTLNPTLNLTLTQQQQVQMRKGIERLKYHSLAHKRTNSEDERKRCTQSHSLTLTLTHTRDQKHLVGR